MTADKTTLREGSCVITAEPAEALAGSDMAVTVRVACTPPCDLTGTEILILNGDGETVGSGALASFDGESNETDEIALTAPATAGTFQWSAVCPPFMKDGVSYPEAVAPVPVTTLAHETNVHVWGLPSSVNVGERFAVKLGFRCAGDCSMAGREMELRDAEGSLLASAVAGDEPAAGTLALHFAELQLVAPETEGRFACRAVVPASRFGGVAHAAGSAEFGVRVVGKPDCVITVEAMDASTMSPLPGAHVVMHPYRSQTGDRGIAELRVRRGSYTVMVSLPDYDPMSTTLAVDADVRTTVWLSPEPPPIEASESY